ncbi:MAG: hypothetical protein FJ123_20410, partial [Deltaproteobacteria bacterium]|nr:hypothetical protein [Deltaproteobacteria bacterium]
MKILLIQPPVRDFYQTSIRTQPIGLAYLAASLQAHGHEVEILDCQTEKKKSIPIPSGFLTSKIFIPSMIEVLLNFKQGITTLEW